MRSAAFLYSLATAFFLGVAVHSLVAVTVSPILFLLVLSVALFLYWAVVRTQFVFLVAFMILMLTVGMGRFLYAEHHVTQSSVSFETSGPHETVSGVVIGEVVEKETTSRFTIATSKTRIIVTSDRFPRVRYGDTVELTGKVSAPERFETDTGRVFNYPAYLAARGVTHQMFYPDVVITDTGGGSFITRNLFHLKEAFLDGARSVVPEPHVSLLGGLVVGAQEAMGDELVDAFRVVGLIHIVVLSGYNITIVAESIMRALGFLSKHVRAIAGATGIILFVILTGATATIVRAGIMALLVILARSTGRTYEIVRALVVTAFLMVFYNPYVLLFDPSFQLSFLATLGLVVLVPFLERAFAWIRVSSGLRSIILATIATQIFVLPLLLFQVGMVSLVSIPVNILVLPLVPTIMLFGLFTGVIGFIHSALAIPFGFVSYGLLGYVLKVVEWFSQLSFASVRVPQISGWMVVGIYVCYALVLFILTQHIKQLHAVS